jgi:putative redox protein
MAQAVEGTVELQGGTTFRASNAAGTTIVLEPSVAGGGSGTGVSPMEALLLALGGCTGVDVVATLRKMRQDVAVYRVELRGERRDEHPRVYTRIAVEHVVEGRGLRPDAVRRAVALSASTYCSVSAMLERAAEVTTTFRAIDTATGAETTGQVDVRE